MSQFAKATNPPASASRINSKMAREIRFRKEDALTFFLSGLGPAAMAPMDGFRWRRVFLM